MGDLKDIYEVKESISSSFSNYDEFAAWLLKEQSLAEQQGSVFAAA